MSRRKPGTGSIFKTKKGVWRGCITVGYTPEGKQLRKWVTARTQKEAVEKLNRMAHLSSSLEVNAPESCTLDQWLLRFIEYRRTQVRAKTTESHFYYRSKLPVWLTKKRLTTIKRSHVRTCYVALAEAELSYSVRLHVHHFLKAALNEAYQDGIILRNPAHVDVPKGDPPKRGATWTPEQVDTFLEVAKGDPLHPLFYTLLHQGVRLGEALAFTWDDYNGETLSVSQTLTMVNGKPTLGPPKTARGYRTFYLLEGTRRVLEAHRHKHKHIFCTSEGTPYNQNNVRRSYYRLVELSGLPFIRIHDHRHTFITLARRAGVPSDVVAAVVGQDPVVTARIYNHISDEQKKEAAEKLEEYLAANKQLEDDES